MRIVKSKMNNTGHSLMNLRQDLDDVQKRKQEHSQKDEGVARFVPSYYPKENKGNTNFKTNRETQKPASESPKNVKSSKSSPELGLQWEKKGYSKPITGTEIKNTRLAEALTQKIEFSRREFDNFRVSDLSASSYIKIDEVYWKPSVPAKKTFDFTDPWIDSEHKHPDLKNVKPLLSKRMFSKRMFSLASECSQFSR